MMSAIYSQMAHKKSNMKMYMSVRENKKGKQGNLLMVNLIKLWDYFCNFSVSLKLYRL